MFAFPSIIPYKKFVIRINEEDFLKNPKETLDQILESYSLEKIEYMRNEMKYWVKYLTFAPQLVVVNTTAASYVTTRTDSNDRPIITENQEKQEKKEKIEKQKSIMTVVPFELMLREIKYHHTQNLREEEKKLKSRIKSKLELELKSKVIATGKDDRNRKLNEISIQKKFITDTELENSQLNTMQNSRNLENSGNLKNSNASDRYCYNPLSCSTRVPPFQFNNLNETRTHLCVHKQRLIGKYKIVYFMQCVRVFWPISPGKFKTLDLRSSGLSQTDIAFLRTFHNITKNTTKDWYGSWVIYPESEKIKYGVKSKGLQSPY